MVPSRVPFAQFTGGTGEEYVGDIEDMLVNAIGAAEYPPVGDDIVLVRELLCLLRRDRFDLTEGAWLRPEMGANRAGSLLRFAVHQANSSLARSLLALTY